MTEVQKYQACRAIEHAQALQSYLYDEGDLINMSKRQQTDLSSQLSSLIDTLHSVINRD